MVHIYIEDEEIICTPSHPFYSLDKGWVNAEDLKTGESLCTVYGESVTIISVWLEILEAPVLVYNFQVEKNHTYYAGSTVVFVHNSCNHNYKWRKERERYWKQRAQTDEPNKWYDAYQATVKNLERMRDGKAPIGWDGMKVVLHHWKGIAVDFYDYSPVTQTIHKLIHYGILK